ncbi:MAG TPA: ADP-ribosyltransferase [Flavobacterium sp.]
MDDFFEWLKGLFKSGKEFALGDEIEAILLPFIKILKENPSFINCIKLVNKNRYFQKCMAIESEAMIKLYTANTYRVLNNALRGINSIKLDKELKAMQRILDEALEKLPISKYNKQLLQRSAFFTEEEISKLFKVGKDFVEKGFMSTTHSQEALERWLISNPSHNVIFKVIGKNGKLIEEASMLPFENEVLFRSETKFIVQNIKKIDHPINRSKLITEIILKEK